MGEPSSTIPICEDLAFGASFTDQMNYAVFHFADSFSGRKTCAWYDWPEELTSGIVLGNPAFFRTGFITIMQKFLQDERFTHSRLKFNLAGITQQHSLTLFELKHIEKDNPVLKTRTDFYLYYAGDTEGGKRLSSDSDTNLEIVLETLRKWYS